ncbi:MAG: 1-acyl-sn-glycerol-3-phosphate acyltransferase [Myxococcales bacterium]|nr:1-acyl-sn-glycerol-3-phosphate acyltransferase [Myxococcales bacterium]
MLDLNRLNRIRVTSRPFAQRAFANLVVRPSYRLFPKVDVKAEGWHNIPKEPVIFVMNHTDRFNYFPLQYLLLFGHDRYTATWVKGKYYENPIIAQFMERTHQIPTVSRGYLITRDFVATTGQRPTGEQYRALRDLVDAASFNKEDPAAALEVVPTAIFQKARNILGVDFRPADEDYAHCINRLFAKMMARFLELNREVFETGLDLLVFPEGTRSIRLSEGRIGISEVALKLRKTVVPIGCNGSDKIYPSANPWAKGGKVTLRVGRPISFEEMAPYHIDEPFEPFHPRDEAKHRVKFRGLTDMFMARINELLDPEYQFSPTRESDGVAGAKRFV